MHTSQNGRPAVPPRRIGEDGCNGICGVADDDAAIFRLDAITPQNSLRDGGGDIYIRRMMRGDVY